MWNVPREVYVISDLHIGGRYAPEAAPAGRGFRLCPRRGVEALTRFVDSVTLRCEPGRHVELVINGDFVDFLAEEDKGAEGDACFVAFRTDEREALAAFNQIVARDRALFDALAALLDRGGRLTILLGNHDVELAFPELRRRLAKVLGPHAPERLTFVYDGEAYVVGDALIEHGNRYDGFNVIDHDALRRMRSLLSRRQPVGPDHVFRPPPGSRLVASIMNPIKERYPFVDLLKPETEAVVPLLLALEPGFRTRALELLRLQREAGRRAPVAPGLPAYGGDAASTGGGVSYGGDMGSILGEGSAYSSDTGLTTDAGSTDDDFESEGNVPHDVALAVALANVMPPNAARRFVRALETPDADGDREAHEAIASYRVREAFGLLNLFASPEASALERRLPALLDALRAVERDRSFDRSVETATPYLEAARALSDGGFRYVLFGHTHLAKRVDLSIDERGEATHKGYEGRTYFNSGTWAELIRFPEHILDRRNAHAIRDLRDFVGDMAKGRFDTWLAFHPTYVWLLVRGERVEEAQLFEYPDLPPRRPGGP